VQLQQAIRFFKVSDSDISAPMAKQLKVKRAYDPTTGKIIGGKPGAAKSAARPAGAAKPLPGARSASSSSSGVDLDMDDDDSGFERF
jgi:hypothetical protein